MFDHLPEGGALKNVPRTSELQNDVLGINEERRRIHAKIPHHFEEIFAIFPLALSFFARNAEIK